MRSVFALAARLRGLDRDGLLTLLRARRPPLARIHDHFDLAERLLEAQSVREALAGLDRAALAALAAAAQLTDGPRGGGEDAIARLLADWGANAPEATAARIASAGALALADPAAGHAVYPEAEEALADLTEQGLPEGPALAGRPPDAPSPDSAPAPDDSVAAERAFEAIAAVAELLAELEREPARELQKGGLTLPDTRRLEEALSASAADTLAVASAAALARLERRAWSPTPAGAGWLGRATPSRWTALADAWRAALPAALAHLLARDRGVLRPDRLEVSVRHAYPASGAETLDAAREALRAAEFLGIAVDGTLGAVGAALVADGTDAAEEELRGRLPEEVAAVYLQQDLSIVAPGPLAPAIDRRLRTLADAENHGLASSYRVNGASLGRAYAAGEDARTLSAFLGEISLTGMPQPLEYLITESWERHGRIRVAEGPDGTTRVVSEDDGLLAAVEVDQTLAAYGLRRAAPGRLEARASRDDVYWALTDAHYPAAVEDDAGRILSPTRHRAPRAAPAPDPARDLADALARAAADTEDAEREWLERRLDAAVRARAALVVTVELPGGDERSYLLEPTGLGAGRLRGLDRQANVERTLPLSSILRLEAAEA